MTKKGFFERFTKCNSDKEQQQVDHKTFYYYFRPIAFICRLIGVIPLENLRDSNSLEFHYTSLPTLYSVLLFCGCVVTFTVLNGRYMMHVLENGGPQLLWMNSLMMILVIRSFVCCYFCASRSKKFIKLIRSLDRFDAKKFEYFKSCLNVRRNIFTCIVKPIIIGLVITVILNTNLWDLSRNSRSTSDDVAISNIMFSFVGIWHVVPLLLYNYFARTIALNLRCINKVIIDIIPSKNWCESRRKEPMCSSCNIKEVLRSIRVLHLLASDAVQHLSNSFGSFLAVDQLYVIVMFVVNIYVVCFVDIDQYSFINCAIIDGIIVLGVIYISHDVTDRANKIAELMQKLPVASLDMDSKLEIQMLLSQIFATPIHISAAGYFKMDREQIPSIMSSIATYLIVLIQFSPQIWPETDSKTINTTKSS